MSFILSEVHVNVSPAGVDPVEVLPTIVETYVGGDGKDDHIPEQLLRQL